MAVDTAFGRHPKNGDQSLPLTGAEQENEEDHAVDQPKKIEAQVPPARQPDGMA